MLLSKITHHLQQLLKRISSALKEKRAIRAGAAMLGLVAVVGAGLATPHYIPQTYVRESRSVAGGGVPPAHAPIETDTRETIQHVPLPETVKAIYMTQCAVGTPSFRASISQLLDDTELNSVVIDIKDYSGTIAFPPESASLVEAWEAGTCGARDMKAFIAQLHAKNIYVIGRITVFQDPLATGAHPERAVKRASDGAVWRDHKGLSFIDVGARDHWEYIETLATDSYNIGFDEINFDYIRFPSDGNMKDIAFTHAGSGPKQEALELFFANLSKEMGKPERFQKYRHENTGRDTAVPYISADLFGMTTTNADDLNIGQVLERTLPYFDFVAPMVYPSHYPDGFNGWADPNAHTYELMKFVLDAAVRRATATTTSVNGFFHERIGTSTPAVYTKPIYDKEKIRPWLQDFDYPVDYTPQMVKNQIDAMHDAGLNSYMFWDPGNKYSSLSQVLKPQ